MFLGTFVVFLVTSLLRTAPKCSAEVLYSVPKCQRAVMCLLEKIHALGELSLKLSLQCCWLLS